MSWLVVAKHKKDVDPWLSLTLDEPLFLHDSMDLVQQIFRSTSYAIRVAYAFTMSDVKTIIIPVVRPLRSMLKLRDLQKLPHYYRRATDY